MVKIMMRIMNKMTTTGNLGGGNPAQPTNGATPINQETKTRMETKPTDSSAMITIAGHVDLISAISVQLSPQHVNG